MDADKALKQAQDHGASYAEVRLESVENDRIEIEDGELQSQVSGEETGFALRVLVDGAWGFASSNDLTPASTKRAVQDAIRLARAAGGSSSRHALAKTAPVRARVAWRPLQDPRDVAREDKQELLLDMDRVVRELPEIRSVHNVYAESHLSKHFQSSEGADVEWSLTRSVAQIHFVARRNGGLSGRSARVGGTRGFELFRERDPVEEARLAAEATVQALGAKAPKGGRQTVVVDHGLAGVFAHEAVGHAAEADLVQAGESCFRDKLGETIGVSGLTIRDDSTLEGAFGSFPYDDNGVAGQDKVLVEDGVLRGFICDRQNGFELDMEPNGGARAQDYRNRPLVRMSNTMIDPGDHSDDEVLDIKEGIYCKGSRGGQVDTARGTFLFNAQDAYRIRDGEVAEPLKDVSLTGSILSTLHNIDALGRKQKLGDPGYCGKGQWVPVCDGGPLVRIRECLVGGAA